MPTIQIHRSVFRPRTALLLVCASLALVACGGKSGPARPTPLAPPEVLYNDNGGGIRDSIRQVIRSPGEFTTVWRKATSSQPTPPALPTVDFTKDMVILVAAGRRTPEDEIHVDSLFTRSELTPANKNVQTLSVVVRTAEGCGRMRIDAFPVQIVRVRKFDGPVKWEERRVKQTC